MRCKEGAARAPQLLCLLRRPQHRFLMPHKSSSAPTTMPPKKGAKKAAADGKGKGKKRAAASDSDFAPGDDDEELETAKQPVAAAGKRQRRTKAGAPSNVSRDDAVAFISQVPRDVLEALVTRSVDSRLVISMGTLKAAMSPEARYPKASPGCLLIKLPCF